MERLWVFNSSIRYDSYKDYSLRYRSLSENCITYHRLELNYDSASLLAVL